MNNLKDLIVSKIESKREIAKSNVDMEIDDFAETLKWVEKDNPKLLKLIQFILDHSVAFANQEKIENISLYIKNQYFFMEVIPNITSSDPYLLINDLSRFISYISDDMEFSVKWCMDIPRAVNKKEKTIEVHPPFPGGKPDENVYPVLFEDCSGQGRQNPDCFFEALKYNKEALEYESTFDKFMKQAKERKQQEMES